MKKKILMFLFALCFMLPFSFVLTACGPTNPPSDPPGDQGGTTGFKLADAITALDELEPNFTSQVTAGYSMELVQNQGASSTSQSQNQNFQNIVLRLDEENMSLDIPSVISLSYIDGYLYSSQQGVDSYSNNLGVLINGIEQTFGDLDFDFGDMLEEGVELAKLLNANALSISEKTTGVDVTVKFEIAPLVSRVQKALKDYKDAKVGDFVNNFAKDVFGVTFDIGDFADSVIEYITDDTTFGDVLELIEQQIDVDIDEIFELFEKFPFRTFITSAYGTTYEGEDEVSLFPWPETAFSAYKNQKILETIDFTKTELIDVYPEMKELYLNNEELTFVDLLSAFADQESVTAMYEILDMYSLGKLDISVVLNFDKQNKLVGYQLKGDAKVTEKVSPVSSNDYIVSGTITGTIANVGSTIVTMPVGYEAKYATITVVTSRTMLAIKNNTITLDDRYMDSFTVDIEVYDQDLQDYVEKTVATYNSTTKKLVIDSFLLEDAETNEIMLFVYNGGDIYMIDIFVA